MTHPAATAVFVLLLPLLPPGLKIVCARIAPRAKRVLRPGIPDAREYRILLRVENRNIQINRVVVVAAAAAATLSRIIYNIVSSGVPVARGPIVLSRNIDIPQVSGRLSLILFSSFAPLPSAPPFDFFNRKRASVYRPEMCISLTSARVKPIYTTCARLDTIRLRYTDTESGRPAGVLVGAPTL